MKKHRSTILFAGLLLAVSACANLPNIPLPNPAAMAMAPAPATVKLTLLPQAPLMQDQRTTILAKLTNIQERSLVTADDLDVTHTMKFHLLMVDQTLTDYQHIHPEPTETPGVWRFNFTPALPGPYRAWADITPSATHRQEFDLADTGNFHPGAIDRNERNETTIGAYRFNLSFDHKPMADEEAMAMLRVTDSNGHPVDYLEPVMGAYAHLVGFYDDFHTLLHAHPLGEESANTIGHGGPDLMFHIVPQKPGFIRLFAQVKIGGREYFVPFGVNVPGMP